MTGWSIAGGATGEFFENSGYVYTNDQSDARPTYPYRVAGYASWCKTIFFGLDPAKAPTCSNLTASPLSGNSPLTVTFTTKASDTDGTVTLYDWDFDGNGTWDHTTTANTDTYTYSKVAVITTYTAKVRVRDNDGGWSSNCETSVTVNPEVPGGGATTADLIGRVCDDRDLAPTCALGTLPVSAGPAGIIMAYASGTAPNGWSRDTALNGKYLKAVSAGEEPGTAGGYPTHSHNVPAHTHVQDSHTHTGTTSGGDSSSKSGDVVKDLIGKNHTHPVTVTATPVTNQGAYLVLDSVVNDPPNKEVVWMRSAGAADLPSGALAFWPTADSPPGGWSEAASYNTFFLKGATGANPGADGGVATHTHAVVPASHTHRQYAHNHWASAAASTPRHGGALNAPGEWVKYNHTHEAYINGATATNTAAEVTVDAVASEPPFKRLKLIQNDSGAGSLPTGVIVAWRGALADIPAGWEVYGGVADAFVKVGAGASGGSLVHTHTSLPHTHLQSSHGHTGVTNRAPDAYTQWYSPYTYSAARSSHTHTVTLAGTLATNQATALTIDNNADTQPPYLEVAFIRYTGVGGGGGGASRLEDFTCEAVGSKPAAGVTVQESVTGKTAVTNEEGIFTVSSLDLGDGTNDYEVCVTDKGTGDFQDLMVSCANPVGATSNCSAITNFTANASAAFGLDDAPRAWFQVSDSDVHSNGALTVDISPLATNPCFVATGRGIGGLVTAAGAIDLNGQPVSCIVAKRWQIPNYSQIPWSKTVKLNWGILTQSPQNVDWQHLVANTVYFKNEDLNLAPPNSYSVEDGGVEGGVAGVVVDGNLNFNANNFEAKKPQIMGIIFLVRNGKTTIAKEVKNIDSLILNEKGTLADGGIITVEGGPNQKDNVLTVNGGLLAEVGLSLERSTAEIDENKEPVEIFNFNPLYFLLLNSDIPGLSNRYTSWHEVQISQ